MQLSSARPAEQAAHLQAEHGDDRDQRIAQAMDDDHTRGRQTLRAGGAHKVLAQDFNHAGPH